MLYDGNEGKSYKIVGIETADEEFKDFLFSLGCYEGEMITLVTKKKHNVVIAVKDGRYNIDRELAKAIMVA